jgi:putative transposase
MSPLSKRTLSPTWMLDHQKRATKTNEKEVPSSQPIDSIRLPQIPLHQNLAHQAIQQGHPARYPYKKKKYFPTKWVKDGFKVYENGKIELSMGIHHGKREKLIVVYVSHLPKGTIKEIECCFDHGLYLAVTYEDGQKAKAYKPGFSVGVDLGEVHTIGAFCENGQALLITGRKIRSLHRLRNKKLAEIQRRQSKCQKRSRRWKKYERAKQYVLSKSERQLRDALHKTTLLWWRW